MFHTGPEMMVQSHSSLVSARVEFCRGSRNLFGFDLPFGLGGSLSPSSSDRSSSSLELKRALKIYHHISRSVQAAEDNWIRWGKVGAKRLTALISAISGSTRRDWRFEGQQVAQTLDTSSSMGTIRPRWDSKPLHVHCEANSETLESKHMWKVRVTHGMRSNSVQTDQSITRLSQWRKYLIEMNVSKIFAADQIGNSHVHTPTNHAKATIFVFSSRR